MAETNDLNELRKALADLNAALVESGVLGEDDAELTQSFIEGETSIPEIIASVISSIDEDLVFVEGLKAMIDEYRKRKDRFEQRIEAKRGMIELALMRADIQKLETPAATVSLSRKARQIATLDESAVPSRFFVPQAPKLDKSALLKALRDGETIEGAQLDNGGVQLMLRRH